MKEKPPPLSPELEAELKEILPVVKRIALNMTEGSKEWLRDDLLSRANEAVLYLTRKYKPGGRYTLRQYVGYNIRSQLTKERIIQQRKGMRGIPPDIQVTEYEGKMIDHVMGGVWGCDDGEDREYYDEYDWVVSTCLRAGRIRGGIMIRIILLGESQRDIAKDLGVSQGRIWQLYDEGRRIVHAYLCNQERRRQLLFRQSESRLDPTKG